MIASIDDIHQRTWDFALTIMTVILLATLGVQSFIGTAAVWWAIRTIPGWEQSIGYTSYVAAMNTIAAPLVVALVVVMGLCVPKRLFSRKLLLSVSVAMIAAGVIAGVVARNLADGLAVYLLLSAAIQLAVVIMTVAGVRGPSYLTQGRLTKVGSGLLHLGFIIFALVVVTLQKSSLMLSVFSLSAVLIGGGTALSFYANSIAWHRAAPRDEAPFEWNGEEAAEWSDEDTAFVTGEGTDQDGEELFVEVADESTPDESSL